MNELSKTTANKVRETLDKVTKRLNEMEIAKNAGPRTNSIFHWNGRAGQEATENGSVRIDKITSVALLISILGFLLTKKAEYDNAAQSLKLSTFPVFTWSKYPLDAWENDISAQLNVITHSDEVIRLTKIKTELSKYVSEEDRVLSILSEIEA